MTRAILLAALAAASLFGQLDVVRSEPNLEKRSDLALAHANKLIDVARAQYKEGKQAEFADVIKQLVEAVELSRKSLADTGKNARKSPKYFKRAELSTRALVKRLETLENEVSLDERPTVTAARKQVSAINDDLVVQIMTKKKS